MNVINAELILGTTYPVFIGVTLVLMCGCAILMGRALASSFEVATRGLIISDRKGTAQAYSLSGALTKAELAQTLEKYADARTLQNTETVVRDAPATVVRPASVSYPATVSYPTVSYPTYAPQYRAAPIYYTSGST